MNGVGGRIKGSLKKKQKIFVSLVVYFDEVIPISASAQIKFYYRGESLLHFVSVKGCQDSIKRSDIQSNEMGEGGTNDFSGSKSFRVEF